MKARELKELKSSNPQDLMVKLGDLKAELFNLRFQLATGQLENPMRIREVKKSIAQIKTILREEELKEFIKTIPNVEWLNPKMSFLEVIEKYGYPIISKEVSEMIYQVHQYKESNPKLIEKRMNGIGKNKVGKIPEI